MKTSIVFLLMSLVCLAGETSPCWYFLPTFHEEVRGIEMPPTGKRPFFEQIPPPALRLLKPDSPLTEAQRNELRWHPAVFPHQDFVRLMPEKRVFGWYACEFDVPNPLSGRDLVLDLGIIDDSDETFLNGHRIGGMGKVPDGSAWQSDRLYRIRKEALQDTRNYLAVHVWSLWGLGGIVGPPVLKAALPSPNAQWELAFVKGSDAPGRNLNSAKTLEEALAHLAARESLAFENAPLPWKAYASWPEEAHFAVFKLTFDLTTADGKPMRFSKPVVIDMGPVFDVAAFYLNGVRVGQAGRFPEDDMSAFTEAAKRGRFLVEKKHWRKDGHNELVAIVYRERGVGGLPGISGILYENPVELKRNAPFAQVTEAFDTLIQSDQLSNAEKLLARAKPKNENEHVWLLSHKAHLAFLKWLDGGSTTPQLLDGVLAPIAESLAQYPIVSPKQSAMQAFCRVLRMAEKEEVIRAQVVKHFPDFGKHGAAFPQDRTTRGDWARNYGRTEWCFGAMAQKGDIYNSFAKPLDYRLAIPADQDYPCLWLPGRQFNLADPDVLSIPDGKEFIRSMKRFVAMPPLPPSAEGLPVERGRIASWWDDHGEAHPFDDNGPDLLLYLNGASTSRKMPLRAPKPSFGLLTLHHQDYDWRNTLHPRQQSFFLLNGNGKLLNAVWLGKTDRGVYQTLPIPMDTPCCLRSVKHRSACVALSGFLLDCPLEYPARVRAKPDYDLHPETHIPRLPQALQEAAAALLATQPGQARIEAGRRYLACHQQCGEVTGHAPAQALFMAIAADAAFDFDDHADAFKRLVASMTDKELDNLLFQLNYFRVHPRWICLAAAELLERLPKLPPTDAEKLLRGFSFHCYDRRLAGFRLATCQLWRQLGLPLEDRFYRRLAETLPQYASIIGTPFDKTAPSENGIGHRRDHEQ